MKDAFFNFLKKHKCKLRWENNYKKFKAEEDLFLRRPDTYIIMSFIWNRTPEGSDYWSELNAKWQKTLQEL